MINLENYSGPVKFGDTKLIEALEWKRKRDLEKTKITIDLKKLMKAGIEKEQAINLMERLVNMKK